MQIDLIVLGVVALFGALGLVSGAAKQISHWIGLVLGLLASRPLAAALAPEAAQRLGWPAGLTGVALGCLLFVALTALGAGISHLILARLMGERENGPVNRVLGLVLGAGKAAAGLFVALSALVYFEKPLARASGAFSSRSRNSKAVAFARERNLFASLRLPALDGMRQVLEAQKDPGALRKLLDDPQLKALLDDPRLKEFLADPALKKAMASGDVSALLKDPKLKELLNDPALAERLAALQKR
ncbi:MAG: CvpA family protein [Elusimicrobia bacterium]|nr:CvpA family protein [Elusimicrobiota bacterium]